MFKLKQKLKHFNVEMGVYPLYKITGSKKGCKLTRETIKHYT
jgi:hypothetical protein